MRRSFVLFLLVVVLLFAFRGTDDIQDGTTIVQVGDKAPDFTAFTVEGKKVKLSHYQGKVVLINFFATWCGPCLRELPEIENSMWRPYHEKGLVVLAVAREEDREKLQPFLRKVSLSFEVIPDPDREIYSLYAKQYIPRNFLVGRDGRVLYSNIGYTREGFRELVEHIQEALTD